MLQPENTIHLSIDMQRLFAAEGPWPTPWMERVLPKVVKLAEHAPARTVFTRFLTPRSPEEMPGMWKEYYRKWQNVTRERIDPKMLDLMPVLERFAPPAQVFDKFVYSAFATGELHQMLRARRIAGPYRLPLAFPGVSVRTIPLGLIFADRMRFLSLAEWN